MNKIFEKHYLGKGTQVPNMQIVRVTVRVSELMKFAYIFENEQYATFEVAKMQRPDKFGRDHTVYCTTQEEVEEEKPTKQSRKKRETAKA